MSEDDLAMCVSEKAMVLGASTEEGFCLYKDLQTAYSSVDCEIVSNKQAEIL